jgi:hypothetical protein
MPTRVILVDSIPSIWSKPSLGNASIGSHWIAKPTSPDSRPFFSVSHAHETLAPFPVPYRKGILSITVPIVMISREFHQIPYNINSAKTMMPIRTGTYTNYKDKVRRNARSRPAGWRTSRRHRAFSSVSCKIAPFRNAIFTSGPLPHYPLFPTSLFSFHL